MTPAQTPASPAPVAADEVIYREVYYPMRTQSRPVRIVYLADPAALACAMLTHPLAVAMSDTARRLVREGEDLAVLPVIGPDGGGETPAGALAHDVAPLNLVLE